MATARRLTSRAATGYESGRLRSPEAILAVGGAICVTVVAGFVVVPTFGGAPYEVAAGADLVLAALCARLPLRVLPVGSVLVVLGLGVLATGAAAHLPVPALLGDASPGGLARAAFASAAVANVMNNLPTVLVALPHLGERASWTAWAVLFGTNAGTLFVPSGSLAVLLWLATIRRLGLDVREQHYVRAAWMVAAPAFAAGAGALVLLRLVLGPSA